MKKIFSILFVLLVVASSLILISCKNSAAVVPCGDKQQIISEFVDVDGTHYTLYNDGKAYREKDGSCEFVEQYYDPRFLQDNYLLTDTTMYAKSGTILFPTKNRFVENFEAHSSLNSVFILRPEETQKFWTDITLQSPLAPTISDYVNLRKCIFNSTCTFLDNRIELAKDPVNPANQVMKFHAVAPSPAMITSKASMESTLTFFRKRDDVWFEGKYFIVGTASQMPYSLVDFENKWFSSSPGPRVVIIDNRIAVENKFGIKTLYKQPSSNAIKLPTGQWVTIKVHIKYDDANAGVVEVWQDGIRIINATGTTLPTSNSIQTNVEIGITATSVAVDMFVDDIRISDRSW